MNIPTDKKLEQFSVKGTPLEIAGGDKKFKELIERRIRSVTYDDLSGASKIPPHFFEDCGLMNVLEIPENVTEIGDEAFKRACTPSANMSLTLSKGLKKLGSSAFYQTHIKRFYINSELTEIPFGCFYAGWDILYMEITSNTVIKIGYNAFLGGNFSEGIILPDSVETFDDYAFSKCSMSNIKLPKNLKLIKAYCFENCKNLTEIKIPDNVTKMEADVFDNCSALASVDLGSGLASIGTACFYSCKALMDIKCRAITPPNLLSNTVFSGVPATCVIHVPAGSEQAYKTATNWSARADYIVGDL